MTTLYREFPIRSASVWQALFAFVKANWQAVMDRGGCIRVIVTEDEKARTKEQNRFFHGPVLDAITDQAWWGGRQYPKEFWKEYLRRLFLLKDEFTTPDGEVIQVYWSTADLNVGQMSEFLNKAQAEAAQEWGVCFE